MAMDFQQSTVGVTTVPFSVKANGCIATSTDNVVGSKTFSFPHTKVSQGFATWVDFLNTLSALYGDARYDITLSKRTLIQKVVSQ